ncbi:MAG TPA: baseplate J/gp47 family protein [Pyrinomonadaceae bacterium]|jgi:uncharacterized phage protein gp47/JayE
MAQLIQAPMLDVRNEDLLAAQAIARVSGALTPELCDRYIAVLFEAKQMLLAGTFPTSPVCAELTNAEPGSPQTVLIETFAWLVSFVTRAINQVPEQNVIEFARLFRAELREATPATTTLLFTSAAPPGVDVIIPAGTEARATNGSVFATDEELVIPAGEMEGAVSATSTASGSVRLAPGTVTGIVDALLYVTAVTNPDAVESGSDAETLEAVLERVRHYQRRGERIVNAKDLQEAILEEVLLGNGIVKVFDKIKEGDWLNLDGSIKTTAGYVTVVMMTSTGHAFSDEVKALAREKANEWVGGIFISVSDPEFVEFNIEVDVKLDGLITQSATLAAIELNLRDFYSAREENFGRTISRSEIIAVIEGTKGVRRIEAQPGGEILAEPVADIEVAPYELPKLVTVTVNVV